MSRPQMEEYYVRSRMQKVSTFHLNAFKSYPIVKIHKRGGHAHTPLKNLVHDGINSVVNKNACIAEPKVGISYLRQAELTQKRPVRKQACKEARRQSGS